MNDDEMEDKVQGVTIKSLDAHLNTCFGTGYPFTSGVRRHM